MSYIKRNEYKILSRDLVWRNDKEIYDKKVGRCGDYISHSTKSISLTLGSAPKKYGVHYYQRKVGYSSIATFLVRMKALENPNCCLCGEIKQIVEHRYV